MNNTMVRIKRGTIYYADLGNGGGSEQSGIRPVVIIQNNIGNKFSPTVIVASLTSRVNKNKLPTHVEINSEDYNYVIKNSVVLLEQIRTIDKNRLKEKLCILSDNDMIKIDNSLITSLAL